jgi:hypothetical protein
MQVVLLYHHAHLVQEHLHARFQNQNANQVIHHQVLLLNLFLKAHSHQWIVATHRLLIPQVLKLTAQRELECTILQDLLVEMEKDTNEHP